MADSQAANGPNGALRGAAWQSQDQVSLAEHGRQLQEGATALIEEVRDTTGELERYLSDQMKRHPYQSLGAAAGIGFVLGGGLQSRLTLVVLGAATRLATAFALREVGARLFPADAGSTQSTAPGPGSGAAKEQS